MSTKQQLAEAIATFPDTLTLEEAVERLYRAFKLKRAMNQTIAQTPRPARRSGSAKGIVQVPADFDAPLADFADYQ
jgi:hypothetical protein